MALSLMYITNSPEVALIAEENGVDRIWIDLETLGKEERQKNMNTVKSHHTVDDVRKVSRVLTKSEMMVRINPWNENSLKEIEDVIDAGAQRIMLPMWKSVDEVDRFLNAVNGRVKTTLLLETKEGEECLDEIIKHPKIDEIHIGLNDLHLSYGLTFMFELLANGTVERICNKLKAAGIRYGFGGIARIGEGTLPADYIVVEHKRLGSSAVILSRTFCNTEEIKDMDTIRRVFAENVKKLRDFEKEIEDYDSNKHKEITLMVKECTAKVVNIIKEKRK